MKYIFLSILLLAGCTNTKNTKEELHAYWVTAPSLFGNVLYRCENCYDNGYGSIKAYNCYDVITDSKAITIINAVCTEAGVK